MEFVPYAKDAKLKQSFLLHVHKRALRAQNRKVSNSSVCLENERRCCRRQGLVRLIGALFNIALAVRYLSPAYRSALIAVCVKSVPSLDLENVNSLHNDCVNGTVRRP